MRPNRNGNLYLQVELSDRSGKINARMWNASEDDYKAFENGDFVYVDGATQLFQGNIQMIFTRVRRARPDEVCESDFITLQTADVERMRWLPWDFPGRYLGVNLAAFRAYVFEGDSIVWAANTVIGKQYHETPMFVGTMTYLVINPYWIVPRSIAEAEILPHVRSDSGYLAKHHMEMHGNQVRQTPGPWNSLGRFKFMFPNRHNVYLHDTPARSLFGQADRAFSHGCVRVEHPEELAPSLSTYLRYLSANRLLPPGSDNTSALRRAIAEHRVPDRRRSRARHPAGAGRAPVLPLN